MTASLEHRGQDGSGHWIDNNIAIGHRRLAIIDLEDRASQPMVDHDGRFVLSYNGEIYVIELKDATYERSLFSWGSVEVLLSAFKE